LVQNGGASDGDFLANNVILDCAHTWIIDKKVYVPLGHTVTIQPGTVIRGKHYSTSDSATAFTVSRGGKLFAAGTADCPIVMTNDLDPLDGTYPISTPTASKWGGLVIAGQASNNLTLDKNGPFQPGVGDGKICVADGLGTFEGFATSDFRDQFGVNLTTPQPGYNTTFDDNDNSGVFTYLSVRFAGAILQVGGEINGISCGSVGRGTTMHHIEVIAAADDNMEFWGGTVNVKYANFMFGDDDQFDWDDGYSGHAQFLFSVGSGSNDTATTPTKDRDNGFEMDADDQASGNGSGMAIGAPPANNGNGHLTGYRSHPVFYNVTFIGTNKRQETSDNTGMAAIMAKELTEGEIYNSVFANFAVGFNFWTGNLPGEGTRVGTTSSTGQAVLDSYDNWRDNNGTPSLKVKCNTFIGMGAGANGAATATLTRDVSKISGSNSYYLNPASHAVTTRDSTQFYVTDNNTAVSSVTGMTPIWAMNPSTNQVTTQYNAKPNPGIPTCVTPPSDGFFTNVNYRGAFAPTSTNWLAGWSYATLLQTTPGLQSCPTDINQDGITNNVDFLQLLGAFNTSCQ
jgi:hypothetical protein